MKRLDFKKITGKMKKIPVIIKNYFNKLTIFEIITKLLYIAVIIIVMINIAGYSYKAWLYPIRTQQYYDECSYIAMGKYFKQYSPITLFKDYLLKEKDIPALYNEFYNRLIYWPIILAHPLSKSDDRIEIHKFRAMIMVIGTIIFFLIGLKLSGLIGGVAASTFWISTPLLNYWGHLLMTENPSFIFLTAGFFFILLSSKSRISSIIGGFLVGMACFTRFTTMALSIASPFLVIAIFFNPFKRKSFQVLSELAKTFSGFVFATLPYLIFTWMLYENPLAPFISSRYNVNYFPVDDPLYYVRNLWLESGDIIGTAAALALITPFIMAISYTLRKIYKDKFRHMINTRKLARKPDNIINAKHIFTKKRLFLRYSNVFISTIIYYAIIIGTLIITTSIYLLGVTDVPHKLPRYLMGALIPVIIIASIGIGVFEHIGINIFRLTGGILLYNDKIFKFSRLKKIIILSVITVTFTAFLISIISITTSIWEKSMARSFYTDYQVPDEVIETLKEHKDFTSIRRLQPEYNAWKSSITERLAAIETGEDTGIDDTDYFNEYFWLLVNYLNDTIQEGEVLYVDKLNRIPFTPAYVHPPTILIDKLYDYSINYLIRKDFIKYKGYFIIFNRPQDEITEYQGKTYTRSLNKQAIDAHPHFTFKKKIGYASIYYYNKGLDFPDDEKMTLNPDEQLVENAQNKEEESLFKKIFHSWIFLLENH